MKGTRTDASVRMAELRSHLDSGIRSIAPESVVRWVGLRQTAQLHAHADLIEKLATIAAELAAFAALETEEIALTAILARRQAIAVQVQRDSLSPRTMDE